MEIEIIPNKKEYYPGEYLTGTIKISPKNERKIKDIEINLDLREEWNYAGQYQKYEFENNFKKILNFYVGVNLFLDKPKNSLITLENKEYTFPFEEKLPNNLIPSFECPKKKFISFVRYTLRADIIAEKYIAFSSIYIKIGSLSYKDNNILNLINSTAINQLGLFKKGLIDLKASYSSKNYKYSDVIPLEIEIDNRAKIKVNECIIKFNRKIILKDKNTFIEKYFEEENLIKEIYKITVNKNENKKFTFPLELRKINLDNLNYDWKRIPYKEKINFNSYLPTLNSNLITCNYSIIIKLKFYSIIPRLEMPKLDMPVYLVHKLNDNNIQEDLEKKVNIKKKEDKNKKIKLFENINKERNNNEIHINLNNNINNTNLLIKSDYDNNLFNDKKEVNYIFNNQNKEDDLDLPSRETIIRIYNERDKSKENNNMNNDSNINNYNIKEMNNISNIKENNIKENDNFNICSIKNNNENHINFNSNNNIKYNKNIENNLNQNKINMNPSSIENNLITNKNSQNIDNNNCNNYFQYPSLENINCNEPLNDYKNNINEIYNNNFINNDEDSDSNMNRESNYNLFSEDNEQNNNGDNKDKKSDIIDINAID